MTEFNSPFLSEEEKAKIEEQERLNRLKVEQEQIQSSAPNRPETEEERIARERAEVGRTEEEILAGTDVGFVGDLPLTPPVPQDRPSSPQIAKIKEVPPAQPTATVADHNRLKAAMRGRLESDIPLNDPYWDIRNEIIIKSRVP